MKRDRIDNDISNNKKLKSSVDIEILKNREFDNEFGANLLCKLIDIGLTERLTTVLEKFFTYPSENATYRESFIYVLTSIIGDENVINDFLKQFGGKYLMTENVKKLKQLVGKCVVVSGEDVDSTHYRSFNPTQKKIYNSYVDNHQLRESHGFCQVFAIINAVKHIVTKYTMIPWDFTGNSYKALLFTLFIIDNVNPSILQKSIDVLYKTPKEYDITRNNKLTIDKIKNIIVLFKEIDIFPLIIDSSSSIEMFYDDISAKQILQKYEKSNNRYKIPVSVSCLRRINYSGTYIGSTEIEKTCPQICMEPNPPPECKDCFTRIMNTIKRPFYGFSNRKSKSRRRRKSVKKSKSRRRRKSVKKSKSRRRRRSVKKSKSRKRRKSMKKSKSSRRRKSVKKSKSRRRKSMKKSKSRRRKSMKKSKSSRRRKSVKKSKSRRRKSMKKSKSSRRRKSVKKSKSRRRRRFVKKSKSMKKT
jgi:hypothetical protein